MKLSALLNSTADAHSGLDGRELVKAKVSELVIMGGSYPSGHSWNFWGSDASLAAHVINTWDEHMPRLVFVGDDVGKYVRCGGPLMSLGPSTDPVRMAYIYYGYNSPLSSWDPLAVLFAANGLGRLFKFGNDHGRNHIEPNGTNRWIWDQQIRNQFFIRLNVDHETATNELDQIFLEAANAFAGPAQPKAPSWHQEL